MAAPADGVYAGWLTAPRHRRALPGRDQRRHQPDLRRRARAPGRGLRPRPRRPRALRRRGRGRVRRAAARHGARSTASSRCWRRWPTTYAAPARSWCRDVPPRRPGRGPPRRGSSPTGCPTSSTTCGPQVRRGLGPAGWCRLVAGRARWSALPSGGLLGGARDDVGAGLALGRPADRRWSLRWLRRSPRCARGVIAGWARAPDPRQPAVSCSRWSRGRCRCCCCSSRSSSSTPRCGRWPRGLDGSVMWLTVPVHARSRSAFLLVRLPEEVDRSSTTRSTTTGSWRAPARARRSSRRRGAPRRRPSRDPVAQHEQVAGLETVEPGPGAADRPDRAGAAAVARGVRVLRALRAADDGARRPSVAGPGEDELRSRAVLRAGQHGAAPGLDCSSRPSGPLLHRLRRHRRGLPPQFFSSIVRELERAVSVRVGLPRDAPASSLGSRPRPRTTSELSRRRGPARRGRRSCRPRPGRRSRPRRCRRSWRRGS